MQTYANVDFGATTRHVTKKDMEDVGLADYVYNHNHIGNDYYKDIKASLRNREDISSKVNSTSYGDFKRDMCGYGIFDKIGINVDDKLALDMDDENISVKFEKLMAERKKVDLMLPTKQKVERKSGR